MSYEFDNIDSMLRNRDVEGKTGTELGLPGGQTLIVLAASDANPRWRVRTEEVRQELTRLAAGRSSTDAVRHYLAGVYAETLVLGWRGVTMKGVEVPFSPEACTAFLRRVDDAYSAVDAMVYDTKNFRGRRAEAVVAEAKN